MIQLAPVIKTKLLTYHARVYFVNAPSLLTFPYVTFDFPTGFAQEEQEIFNLDVDIWGNSPDTTAIDTLAQTIWRGLNKWCHIDDDVQLTIHRMNRLILDDDDPQIERRKLIFQLRYYDRRLNNE